MVTRRIAALILALAVAGCANSDNTEPGAAGPDSSAPSSSAGPSVPAEPSAEPSGGKPTAGGAETITGTVTAGVEPGCLLLADNKGSHLLVFDDAALRAQVKVGSQVTLSGTPKPGMMSTCQQGVPFVVTSVR